LEELSVDGRIIWKWILKKCLVGVWTGFIWLRIKLLGFFNMNVDVTDQLLIRYSTFVRFRGSNWGRM